MPADDAAAHFNLGGIIAEDGHVLRFVVWLAEVVPLAEPGDEFPAVVGVHLNVFRLADIVRREVQLIGPVFFRTACLPFRAH